MARGGYWNWGVMKIDCPKCKAKAGEKCDMQLSTRVSAGRFCKERWVVAPVRLTSYLAPNGLSFEVGTKK